jgi:hypothetical protein
MTKNSCKSKQIILFEEFKGSEPTSQELHRGMHWGRCTRRKTRRPLLEKRENKIPDEGVGVFTVCVVLCCFVQRRDSQPIEDIFEM